MMASQPFLPALRFKVLTGAYDPIVALTTRERTIKATLLRRAAVGAGDDVLDLGCGTGTLALLVKRAEPSARVVGLDADPHILERAAAKFAQEGVHVELIPGMSSALPFDDASFDVVLSSLFFHHLSSRDRRHTAAEIVRVLRPGGRLQVADWDQPQDPLMGLAALGIRAFDGWERTRENLAGALPQILADAGLTEAEDSQLLRTAFGTMSLRTFGRSSPKNGGRE